MKKLFFTLSMALISTLVLAVPAKRGLWKTVKLTDGTEVKVELRGDEFFHYWRSADGRAFKMSEKTGIYEEANLNDMTVKAAKRRNTANETRVKRSPLMRAADKRNAYEGEKKGLIVLVNFTDVKFKSEHTLDLYKRIANEEGFSEMGFRGSVKDYFKDQSYGKFSLDFDVVGPVELSHECAYYGSPAGGESDNMPAIGQMVVDACTAAAKEYDLSTYDWDGDGEVEQVFILYAGYGEATGGESWTIWPHEYVLRGAIGNKVKIGDVYIDTYACGNELVPTGNSYQTSGLGTICHEFSHCLGLPDMYDTSDNGYYGMGSWSLMDQGSYNGDQFCPAGYTSYERMYSGWLQPTELTDDCQIDNMKALTDNEEAYIIYNDNNKNEYYLLENRPATGWDSYTPNSGMLILHVDYNAMAWASNTVNSTSRQRCTIFPADNSASLYTETGDTYPYSYNNSLTNSSTPAATLNNKNTDGSMFMNKSIRNITKNSDGTISFSFENENNAREDYDLPQSYIFYESFDKCNGKGGNDGKFNATTSGSIVYDHSGWKVPSGRQAAQCALLGSTTVTGQATTPEITMTGECTLMFKAAPYASETNSIKIEIAEGSGTISKSSFILSANRWSAFSTKINANGPVKIRFYVDDGRFYLDKVCVTDGTVSGIDSVTTDNNKVTDNRIYSIDGRYMGKDMNALKKGIYIINGKKIVK